MQNDQKIFALDIGTRSVVGIILEKHDNQYHVVDMLSIEHAERAMLDGQIHDVLSVSNIISQIKKQLEEKHGPLKKVSVAAAGRALKTEKAEISIDIKGKPLIQKEDILHLELTAVQKAQSAVAEKFQDKESHYYYCVGYSVLYYRLDGELIGNLIDQQGEEASVEIIATFLPKVVVESLISALQRADLEMDALTLEPIAAINVLIPPTMRRLNVALVDIGAGTSDIAITENSTITAYGMVPIAGDEITEAISDNYLLDFPLAEKAKRDLLDHDMITITDILGFEQEIPKEEVISSISETIDKLAANICQEILQLNGDKPPKAVMLIGGGSLTPELPKRITEKLELPPNRVAIRGIDAIQSLTFADHITKGPELVTPIGIAIAANKTPLQYTTVYVNEQPVRLFEIKELTVGVCLLAAGIKMNKLYGRPGMAKIVTINGQEITIPGQYGSPPILLKNGEECSFEDIVQNGDRLTIEKGKDGESTVLIIKDLLDEIPKKTITINGEKFTVEATILKNQRRVTAEELIDDRDIIEWTIPDTIEEILKTLQLTHYLEDIKPFHITINGKEVFIPSFSGKLFKNGMEGKLYHTVDDLDELYIEKKQPITVKDLAVQQQFILNQSIPVIFNEQEIMLTKPVTDVKRNGNNLEEDALIFEGDELIIEQGKFEPFIFQDLFLFVDIQLPNSGGKHFQLRKNGLETTFYDKIEPGDKLEIIWQENTTLQS